jgi:hypothetical protein
MERVTNARHKCKSQIEIVFKCRQAGREGAPTPGRNSELRGGTKRETLSERFEYNRAKRGPREEK